MMSKSSVKIELDRTLPLADALAKKLIQSIAYLDTLSGACLIVIDAVQGQREGLVCSCQSDESICVSCAVSKMRDVLDEMQDTLDISEISEEEADLLENSLHVNVEKKEIN